MRDPFSWSLPLWRMFGITTTMQLGSLIDVGPYGGLTAGSSPQMGISLGLLGMLQAIAQWRMENYTTEEIAAKLGCVPRTVERKLRVIRGLWANELSP